MSTRFKIVFACALLVLLIGIFTFIVSNAKREGEAQRESKIRHQDKMLVGQLAGMNIVNVEDGTRLQQITHIVVQTHAISDDDLDWMLSLLKRHEHIVGTSTNQTDKSAELRMIDLGTLRLVKETSPQQQAKVFIALIPLLYGTDVNSKGEADRTLAAFKVTQAIPYIQPQLKDPNRGVRRDAKAALAAFAS